MKSGRVFADLTLTASEELCKLLKCAHLGSLKPCFHPVLQGKYFPTGKATTLKNLSVIGTYPIIFLNLDLSALCVGGGSGEQVLPRWAFSLPSLRIQDDFLNIRPYNLLFVHFFPCQGSEVNYLIKLGYIFLRKVKRTK